MRKITHGAMRGQGSAWRTFVSEARYASRLGFHAKEYVEVIWQMPRHKKARLVVATRTAYSVQDSGQVAFEHAGS
jgi:GDP-D-mannose dehydratase